MIAQLKVLALIVVATVSANIRVPANNLTTILLSTRLPGFQLLKIEATSDAPVVYSILDKSSSVVASQVTSYQTGYLTPLILDGSQWFTINANSGEVSLISMPSLSGYIADKVIKIVVQCSDVPPAVLGNVTIENIYVEIFVTVVVIEFPHFIDVVSGDITNVTVYVPRNAVPSEVADFLAAGFPWKFVNGSSTSLINMRYNLNCSTEGIFQLDNLTAKLTLINVSAWWVPNNLRPKLDCSILITDSTISSKTSTTSLTIIPTAMFVRSTIAICGAPIDPTVLLQAPTVINSSYILSSQSDNSGTCPPTSLGTQLQVETLCFSQSSCAIIVQSWKDAFTNGSLANSIFLSALRTAFPTYTLFTALIFPFAIIGSNNSLRAELDAIRAPFIFSKTIFYNEANFTLTAAALARGTAIDFDRSALTIAITSVSGNGVWTASSGSTTLTIRSTTNITSAVILSGTSLLKFMPNAGYHGVIDCNFFVFKDWNELRGIKDLNVFLSDPLIDAGPMSRSMVRLVALIFPMAATNPKGPHSSILWGPALTQSYLVPNTGSFQIRSVINSSLIIDEPITDMTLSADVGALATIPSKVLTSYKASVVNFNYVSIQRNLFRQTHSTMGVAVNLSSAPTVNGRWEVSILESSVSQIFNFVPIISFGVVSDKVLLLPGNSFLRFVPSPLYVGSPKLNMFVWDTVQGIPGTTQHIAAYPGALSQTSFYLAIKVNFMNSRPKIVDPHVSMQNIPSAIIQQAPYVTNFLISGIANVDLFYLQADSFIQIISLLTSSYPKVLTVTQNGTTISVLVKASDIVSAESLKASELIARYNLQNTLTSTSIFPFIIVSLNVYYASYGVNPSCKEASTAAYNTGSIVGSLAALASKDLETPSSEQGIAIISHSNLPAASGTWMYQIHSSSDWQTLPPVSTTKAFLVRNSTSIRFSPAENYYGSAYIVAVAWDASQYTNDVFVSVSSNADYSPFSDLPFNISVQRTRPSSEECNAIIHPIVSIGCDNVPFSGISSDKCGMCRGSNLFQDCNGVCFGSAMVDVCGICRDFQTTLQHVDCAGVCGGSAKLDSCGDCAGGNTSNIYDGAKDCNGVCNGIFKVNDCGLCQSSAIALNSSLDCFGICFGDGVLDDCKTCRHSYSSVDQQIDSCGVHFGCDNVANSNLIFDQCGKCGGNSDSCLNLTSLTPSGASTTRSTTVIIYGAGFISGPNTDCKFQFASKQFKISTLIILNASFATCDTPNIDDIIFSGNSVVSEFTVSIDGIHRSNIIDFIFYKASGIAIISASSSIDAQLAVGIGLAGVTTQSTDVIFSVTNAVAIQKPKCFLGEQYNMILSASQLNTPNTSFFKCVLPSVAKSGAATLKFSLTGNIVDSVPFPSYFTFYAPAPKLQSATLMQKATIIQIKWDLPVNESTLINCAKVWSVETLLVLGSSTCSFISSTVMLIFLATNAQVVPTSTLSVRSSMIYAKNELFSFPCIGRVVVSLDLLDTLMSPVANIRVVQAIPKEGVVTVDGYFSTSPGYSPIRYHFSVYSTGPTKKIDEILKASNSLSPSISLLSEYFVEDNVYIFSLKVTNFFSESLVAFSLPLLKNRLITTPSASSSSSSLVEYEDHKMFYISSQLFSLSAAPVGNFKWTIDRCHDNTCSATSFLDFEFGAKTTPAVVQIDPARLIPYSIYIVRQIASIQVPNQLVPSKVVLSSKILQVTVQPEMCFIAGGFKTIADNKNVTLSVYFPGRVLKNYTQVLWVCQTAAGTACVYRNTNTSIIPMPKISLLTLDSLNFKVGDYVFSARVIDYANPKKKSSCFVNVSLFAAGNMLNQPTVSIAPQVSKVFSTKRTIIEAAVTSVSEFSYKWVCDTLSKDASCLNLNSSGSVKNVLANETIPLTLIIAPNLLIASQSYTFRLIITGFNLNGASASITFTVARPLWSRTLCVSMDTMVSCGTRILTGKSLYSKFTVYFLESITDIEMDYLYVLRVSASATGDGGVIVASSSQPTFTNVLPEGLSSTNYTIILSVDVTNSNGQLYRSFTVEVQVLPWFWIETSVGVAYFKNMYSNAVMLASWDSVLQFCAVFGQHRLPINSDSSVLRSYFEIISLCVTSIKISISGSPAYLHMRSGILQSFAAFTVIFASDLASSIVTSADTNNILSISTSIADYNSANLGSIEDAVTLTSAWALATTILPNLTNILGIQRSRRGVSALSFAEFISTEFIRSVSNLGRVVGSKLASLDEYTFEFPGAIRASARHSKGDFDTCPNGTISSFLSEVVSLDSFTIQKLSKCSVTLDYTCDVPYEFVAQLALATVNRQIIFGTNYATQVTNIVLLQLGQTLTPNEFLAQTILVDLNIIKHGSETMFSCCSANISMHPVLTWQCNGVQVKVLSKNSKPYVQCSFQRGTLFAGFFVTGSATTTSTVTSTSTSTTSSSITTATTSTSTTSTSTRPPSVLTTTLPRAVRVLPTTAFTVADRNAASNPSATIDTTTTIIYIVLPIGFLIILAVAWIAIRGRRRRSRISVLNGAGGLRRNDSRAIIMGKQYGVQICKVVITGFDGTQQEIVDFHLTPAARLEDARRALKKVLPGDSVIFFEDQNAQLIDLALENGRYVGDVMRNGTLHIKDETNSASAAIWREFCICGAVSDFVCSNCRLQGYCNVSCQEEHWLQSHAEQCGKNVAPLPPSLPIKINPLQHGIRVPPTPRPSGIAGFSSTKIILKAGTVEKSTALKKDEKKTFSPVTSAELVLRRASMAHDQSSSSSDDDDDRSRVAPSPKGSNFQSSRAPRVSDAQNSPRQSFINLPPPTRQSFTSVPMLQVSAPTVIVLTVEENKYATPPQPVVIVNSLPSATLSAPTVVVLPVEENKYATPPQPVVISNSLPSATLSALHEDDEASDSEDV